MKYVIIVMLLSLNAGAQEIKQWYKDSGKIEIYRIEQTSIMYDTVRAIMLVCDTTSTHYQLVKSGYEKNPFPSAFITGHFVNWMYGYEIRRKIPLHNSETYSTWESFQYFDDEMHPLTNTLVWMSVIKR